MKKKITEEFIEEAKEVHGDKYDYSLVDYKNNYTKVKIICSKHGLFEQRPADHLRGCICLKCKYLGNSVKEMKSCNSFIEEAKEVHGDKYDYSLVDYKNNYTKVKIICKRCQKEFEQTPKAHLMGQGCPLHKGESKIFGIKKFIDMANEIHFNKYDYSSAVYVNSKTKIKIRCTKCGYYFEQTPTMHLSGQGCKECAINNRRTTVEEKRARSRLYQRERRRETSYRIRSNLSTRLYSAVKKKNGNKSTRTVELIGCSIEELMKHLENQFQEGMTWDNYGEWHIDHIRPCSSFNLLLEEEQKICFHYSNLQPLWAEENLKKGGKWKENENRR